MFSDSATPMIAASQLSQPVWPELRQPQPQPTMHPEIAATLESVRQMRAEIQQLRLENKRLRGCLRSSLDELKLERVRNHSRADQIKQLKAPQRMQIA